MIGLLAAAAIGTSGCGGPEDDGKATLELWTMQLKPTFTDYIGNLIAEWEKAHPEADVVWTDLPASEIENKTLAAAASGQPPDLINLNPAFSNKLANAKALTPITLTTAEREAYFEAAWEANTMHGEVIGVPWYLSSSVTLFNTGLWKRAGLPVGEWPRTYRQLADASRVIKEKTGALGFMPPLGDRGKFMELLAADGVPLLTEDGKAAAFAGPEGVRVLEFWLGLFEDGVIPQESLNQTHREAIDRFQAGQTAVFPAGPQFLRIIEENSPKLYTQLAVGPQITGEAGKVGVSVMNLVIPKSTEHPELARDLAFFLTSGENQLAFSKLVPILPSVKAAAADPYFQAGEDAGLSEQARALAAEQLTRATLLVKPLPKQSELARSLDEALQRAVLGHQSPEEALKQAAKEWNQLLGS